MVKFFIAAFLTDLALGAVLLSLPLLLIYKFGVTSLQLGLFGALGAFVYSSGVLAIGRLSDRFNRRNILISGCLLFIAVYLVMPLLKDLRHLYLLYVLGAISMSLFWPTIQSWLSQGLDKDRLLRSLTYFNISWSAGLTFGFLSAGFLFSLHIYAPFLFGVSMVAIVVLLLFRQSLTSEMRDEPARKVFLRTERERPEMARHFLIIAWCANFVSWYVVGLIRNLFPKLGTTLGFSASAIGSLVFLMLLSQTLMFYILGRTHRWHYRLLPIVFFQILAIAALITMSRTSNILLFALPMVFLGLSGGMTYFSSIFYSLFGFIDKGKRSGIHEAFIGTGAFLGPFVGGFVASAFDMRAPYLVAAFLIAVTVLVESVIWHRGRRQGA